LYKCTSSIPTGTECYETVLLKRQTTGPWGCFSSRSDGDRPRRRSSIVVNVLLISTAVWSTMDAVWIHWGHSTLVSHSLSPAQSAPPCWQLAYTKAANAQNSYTVGRNGPFTRRKNSRIGNSQQNNSKPTQHRHFSQVSSWIFVFPSDAWRGMLSQDASHIHALCNKKA